MYFVAVSVLFLIFFPIFGNLKTKEEEKRKEELRAFVAQVRAKLDPDKERKTLFSSAEFMRRYDSFSEEEIGFISTQILFDSPSKLELKYILQDAPSLREEAWQKLLELKPTIQDLFEAIAAVDEKNELRLRIGEKILERDLVITDLLRLLNWIPSMREQVERKLAENEVSEKDMEFFRKETSSKHSV